MSGDNAFAELMYRGRRGDACAAEGLLRQVEPQVRREVQLRLRDPRRRPPRATPARGRPNGTRNGTRGRQ
jgi:hypothetical protein